MTRGCPSASPTIGGPGHLQCLLAIAVWKHVTGYLRYNEDHGEKHTSLDDQKYHLLTESKKNPRR